MGEEEGKDRTGEGRMGGGGEEEAEKKPTLTRLLLLDR